MSTPVNPYDVMFNGVKLDPYRLFTVYKITHPAQQHAIKKLLRAGRSNKSLIQDIQETIVALNRWLEMIHEEGAVKKAQYPTTQAEAFERLQEEQAAQERKSRASGHRKLKSRGHRGSKAKGRRVQRAREEEKGVVPSPGEEDQGSRVYTGKRDPNTTVTYDPATLQRSDNANAGTPR